MGMQEILRSALVLMVVDPVRVLPFTEIVSLLQTGNLVSMSRMAPLLEKLRIRLDREERYMRLLH